MAWMGMLGELARLRKDLSGGSLGLGVWVERGGFLFGMLGMGDFYLRMRAGT